MSSPRAPGDSPPLGPGDELAPSPQRLGCGGGAAFGIVGALMLVGIAAGLLIGRCSVPPAPPPAASVTVVRPTPNVVRAIRDLSRLEGAQYHMERVIDLTEKQTRFFGLIEAEDAILLVASGDVIAGIDLAELGDDDVVVDAERKSVRIKLPPPKILTSRLDNERTYVHTRKTDALAQRKESLETRARKEAENSIVEAATQAGILERARQSNKRTVESLVRSLGFDHVSVEFE
jgi:hypothetical protein